jgi:uncharacterized membrane protein YkoI
MSAVGALAPARANEGSAQSCLSDEEQRETVTAKRVVSPATAIHAARQAVPSADVVRATLCYRGNKLVYWIVALRGDGKFVHVTIDASSGKLAGMR